MGKRCNEPDRKHRLDDLIAENREEIDGILLQFGVPLLDRQDRLIMEMRP
jgi:hypothetical protein